MSETSEIKVESKRKSCLYDEYFRHSTKSEEYEFDSIGFRFWHFSAQHADQGVLKLPNDKDYIIMCYCLEGGKVEVQHSHPSENPIFDQQQHNLLFLPKHELGNLSIQSEGTAEFFAVLMEIEVFFKYFPAHSTQLFIDFSEKVKSGEQVALLNKVNYNIHLAMKGVINSMVGSKRMDDCKHIYFNAKIIELLGLQLEQCIEDHKEERSIKKLKQEEVDRIQEVKNLLDNHPEKSYTLLGLAREVGTNDATLKKHFKMVYGTTVFTYLNTCRMEKAHLILEKYDYKISQVAEEVGFRHASHFSSAFKKYFGYSPGELRMMN